MECNDGDAALLMLFSRACTHTLSCILPAAAAIRVVYMPHAGRYETRHRPGRGINDKCSMYSRSCFGMEMSPGSVLWTNISGTAAIAASWLARTRSRQPDNVPAGSASGNLTKACASSATTAPLPPRHHREKLIQRGDYGDNDCRQNSFDNASCTSAADCDGKTVLGTWHMAWNGAAVPWAARWVVSRPSRQLVGVTRMTFSQSLRRRQVRPTN